jgi:hypothetical protein
MASNAGGSSGPAASGRSGTVLPLPVAKAEPPANLAPPQISGAIALGAKLRCSSGSWSGSPTAFAYQWNRDGQPIAGATDATYAIDIPDEARTLSCTVTASNADGSSPPSTSAGELVALRGTLRCPRPTGRLAGTALGPLALGMSRRAARERLPRFSVDHRGFDHFCMFAGWGIRAGYATSALLAELPSATRGRLRGRIVMALAANTHYALSGVRSGTRLKTAHARLSLEPVFHIGLNDWYVAPLPVADGILKVRHGKVEEVGLADRDLMRTRADQHKLLKSWGP